MEGNVFCWPWNIASFWLAKIKVGYGRFSGNENLRFKNEIFSLAKLK